MNSLENEKIYYNFENSFYYRIRIVNNDENTFIKLEKNKILIYELIFEQKIDCINAKFLNRLFKEVLILENNNNLYYINLINLRNKNQFTNNIFIKKDDYEIIKKYFPKCYFSNNFFKIIYYKNNNILIYDTITKETVKNNFKFDIIDLDNSNEVILFTRFNEINVLCSYFNKIKFKLDIKIDIIKFLNNYNIFIVYNNDEQLLKIYKSSNNKTPFNIRYEEYSNIVINKEKNKIEDLKIFIWENYCYLFFKEFHKKTINLYTLDVINYKLDLDSKFCIKENYNSNYFYDFDNKEFKIL